MTHNASPQDEPVTLTVDPNKAGVPWKPKNDISESFTDWMTSFLQEQEHGADETLTFEEQSEIALGDNEQMVNGLTRNAAVHPEVQELLLKRFLHPVQASSLAKNPAVTLETLVGLRERSEDLTTVASSPNAPREWLEEALAGSVQEKLALAENASLPLDLQPELAQCSDVWYALQNNPNLRWDLTFPVPFVKHAKPDLLLGVVLALAVDEETWNSLVDGWTGSVADLVIATRLV